MELVALPQPAEDADRLLDVRLVHVDRLEAPLERRVLLDVLAVLIEGRRADHVQLAAREHRLEEVRRVHRALGRPGADDRVQLVEEQHDLAFGVLDLLEHRLESLLELAPVLRSRDESAEVERDHALLLQALRHVATDDPLREALGDGGLPDARLADEDGVVLRPPTEDLDDAADLLVAPDDRVERARTGVRGQVAAVALERLVRALGVLRGDALVASHRLQRGDDRLVAGADRIEQALGVSAREGRREEQVLGRDVLVAEALGLVLRALDQRPGPRVEAELAAFDARASAEHRRELHRDLGRVGTELAQDHDGDALAILEERGEDVLGVEHGARGARGELLGGEDGLLGLLGVAIEFHGVRPMFNAPRERRRGVVMAGRGSRRRLSRARGPPRRDAWGARLGCAREGRRARHPSHVGAPAR